MPWTPGGKHGHERPRRPYRGDAGEPALRREDPLRRCVPLAGGARQEALPHAWRCAGIRRAKGQPERAQARSLQQGRDQRAKADSRSAGRRAEVSARDKVMFFARVSVCAWPQGPARAGSSRFRLGRLVSLQLAPASFSHCVQEARAPTRFKTVGIVGNGRLRIQRVAIIRWKDIRLSIWTRS